MNKRNKRITSYFILFSLFIVLGVAFAILQANLQINGTAKIAQNTWDVHFENVVVNPDSVSIGTGDTAATIDPNNNCKVDFEVTLSLPGDFYEFTVDVKNEGTIDAMIGTLNKSLKVNNVEAETVPEYLNYLVTYDDGGEILENHLLASGETETYKILIKYNDDINAVPDAATLTMSVEPVYIQADSGAISRPVGMLIDGPSLNVKMKQLAGINNPTTDTYSSSIKAFKKSSIAPDMNSMTNENIVSVSTEDPIYMWFDDGTIYYYSSSDIYLNEDSSYMFYKMTYLSIIELDTIKTNKTSNMSNMFGFAGQNATTWSIGDISGWDTSKVTNMSDMFSTAGYNATTWSIGDLSNWDTSQVTNMSSMFSNSGYNATTWNIGDLSNWDTSQVTNMSYIFYFCGYNATTWSIGDLSNWDTSQVTNMSFMFSYAGKNATTWNSIGSLKVYATNINAMFFYCKNAKATLKIYNNPTSYSSAFNNAATVSGSGITVDYTNSVTNIDNIIATKSPASNVVKGSLLS